MSLTSATARGVGGATTTGAADHSPKLDRFTFGQNSTFVRSFRTHEELNTFSPQRQKLQSETVFKHLGSVASSLWNRKWPSSALFFCTLAFLRATRETRGGVEWSGVGEGIVRGAEGRGNHLWCNSLVCDRHLIFSPLSPEPVYRSRNKRLQQTSVLQPRRAANLRHQRKIDGENKEEATRKETQKQMEKTE